MPSSCPAKELPASWEAVTLPCPRSSHGCSCSPSTSQSRSCGQAQGYLWLHHPECFVHAAAPVYLQGTGVLCPVDCPAPPSVSRAGRYLVPKFPGGHLSTAEPFHTSLLSATTSYCRYSGIFLSHAWPGFTVTQQWERRHLWAGLAGPRCIPGGPGVPRWWDGAQHPEGLVRDTR